MPSQAQSDLTKNTQMFTEEELASVRGAARRSLIVTEPAPRERSSLVLPYNPCVSPRVASEVLPYTPCVSPREGAPATELVLPYHACRSRSCSRSHSPVHL
jgi:hypothetical protein